MREDFSKKDIARMGNALLDLRILEIRGSYCNQVKYVFVTGKFYDKEDGEAHRLPRHKFRNGDFVGIFSSKKQDISHNPL